MRLSPVKAVAFPLSLVAAGLVAIGGSVAANQDEDQKAESKDKPAAEAQPEPELDQPRSRRARSIPTMTGGGVTSARQEVARLSIAVAKNEENPEAKAALEALDQPFTLQLTDDSTLADLVDQIKETLTTADGKKVPVYVDPRGIEEAGVALDSPVEIDLEDVPLKLSLRLALKQLNLAYCVRDGVLIISSFDGVLQELKEAQSASFATRGDPDSPFSPFRQSQ